MSLPGEMWKCQLLYGCIMLKCRHPKLYMYVCQKQIPEISYVGTKEGLEIFPLSIV